jgi:hypothetical protein
VGAAGDLVVDGVTGKLLADNSPAAIAGALLSLYEDRAAAQPILDRHQALMWRVGDLMHQWEELQSVSDRAADAMTES